MKTVIFAYLIFVHLKVICKKEAVLIPVNKIDYFSIKKIE